MSDEIEKLQTQLDVYKAMQDKIHQLYGENWELGHAETTRIDVENRELKAELAELKRDIFKGCIAINNERITMARINKLKRIKENMKNERRKVQQLEQALGLIDKECDSD